MNRKIPLICYYASGCESGDTTHHTTEEARIIPTPFLTADDKLVCTRCFNPESHQIVAIVIDYQNPPNPYFNWDAVGTFKLTKLIEVLQSLNLIEFF
jgi:hypothetical protein